MGWEDDWMIKFKQKHYDVDQTVELKRYPPDPGTPYQDNSMANIPAYIPARMPLSPESQKIPRVIFLSWRTRGVGPIIFLSIKDLLLHNPEYELIFMDDKDVDEFVCKVYSDMAPDFGKLKAGAARADVWRMLVMYRYGGIYLDIDMTTLSHFNIPADASMVSAVGYWGHLPGNGGVLEHWILVYEPKHKLIKKTLELIKENLKDPNNNLVTGEEYIKAEQSETIRLTGPAVYQRALRAQLEKCQCNVSKSTEELLSNPGEFCNLTIFRQEFGNFVHLEHGLDHSLKIKLLDYWGEAYWEPNYNAKENKIRADAQENFCDEIDSRSHALIQEWQKAAKKEKKVLS